jgi:hypothetical protein
MSNIEHRILNHEVICLYLPSTFFIRYSIFDIFKLHGRPNGPKSLEIILTGSLKKNQSNFLRP